MNRIFAIKPAANTGQAFEDYGFVYKQATGSHFTFSYSLGGQTKLLVVPFKRPLKPIYVKRAVKMIDQIIQEQGEDGSDDE